MKIKCPFCPCDSNNPEIILKHVNEKHSESAIVMRDTVKMERLRTQAFAWKIERPPIKVIIPGEYVGIMRAID